MLRNLLISACLASLSFGTSLVIGVSDGGNDFPFGGPVGGAGTRYQQAYASADFSGPMAITGIDFFSGASSAGLYTGTYTLSLSTITSGIDTLSDANFDSNVGADNQIFEVIALSGTQPAILSFTGGPFNYDPANGNLLLDISIAGPGSFTGAAFDAANGSATGVFSRYHDFGGGNVGYGLVTQFDFAGTSTPEPSTLVFLGCGLVTIALRRVRRSQ